MKITKTNTETVTYRRTQIELYQTADGFWGWTIGKATLLPTFIYRDIAFGSAKRHIDNNR